MSALEEHGAERKERYRLLHIQSAELGLLDEHGNIICDECGGIFSVPMLALTELYLGRTAMGVLWDRDEMDGGKFWFCADCAATPEFVEKFSKLFEESEKDETENNE